MRYGNLFQSDFIESVLQLRGADEEIYSRQRANTNFVFSNPNNRQFYLDLKNTDDFDALTNHAAVPELTPTSGTYLCQSKQASMCRSFHHKGGLS